MKLENLLKPLAPEAGVKVYFILMLLSPFAVALLRRLF